MFLIDEKTAFPFNASKNDIWSLGTITYSLLTSSALYELATYVDENGFLNGSQSRVQFDRSKHPPIDGCIQNIATRGLRYTLQHRAVLGYFNEECVSFLEQCFAMKEEDRPNIFELQMHPFISRPANPTLLQQAMAKISAFAKQQATVRVQKQLVNLQQSRAYKEQNYLRRAMSHNNLRAVEQQILQLHAAQNYQQTLMAMANTNLSAVGNADVIANDSAAVGVAVAGNVSTTVTGGQQPSQSQSQQQQQQQQQQHQRAQLRMQAESQVRLSYNALQEIAVKYQQQAMRKQQLELFLAQEVRIRQGIQRGNTIRGLCSLIQHANCQHQLYLQAYQYPLLSPNLMVQQQLMFNQLMSQERAVSASVSTTNNITAGSVSPNGAAVGGDDSGSHSGSKQIIGKNDSNDNSSNNNDTASDSNRLSPPVASVQVDISRSPRAVQPHEDDEQSNEHFRNNRNVNLNLNVNLNAIDEGVGLEIPLPPPCGVGDDDDDEAITPRSGAGSHSHSRCHSHSHSRVDAQHHPHPHPPHPQLRLPELSDCKFDEAEDDNDPAQLTPVQTHSHRPSPLLAKGISLSVDLSAAIIDRLQPQQTRRRSGSLYGQRHRQSFSVELSIGGDITAATGTVADNTTTTTSAALGFGAIKEDSNAMKQPQQNDAHSHHIPSPRAVRQHHRNGDHSHLLAGANSSSGSSSNGDVSDAEDGMTPITKLRTKNSQEKANQLVIGSFEHCASAASLSPPPASYLSPQSSFHSNMNQATPLPGIVHFVSFNTAQSAATANTMGRMAHSQPNMFSSFGSPPPVTVPTSEVATPTAALPALPVLPASPALPPLPAFKC